jgi:hypothetical protein
MTHLGGPAQRGLYFVVDDTMFDFAVAFLNSVRKHNPFLPLCLIPFNDRVERVVNLREQFDFSVWQQQTVLKQCDDISLGFHQTVAGHYRKLAIWEGPFEEFVYIDVDTTVLLELTFVFNLLDSFDFVVSWSSPAHGARWVWKDSIWSREILTREQIEFGANTSFLASKKSSLTLADIIRQLSSALDLASDMDLGSFEQPLLNYLIVTSGKRYTSLAHIHHSTDSLEVPMEIGWRNIGNVRDGKIISTKTAVPPNPMLLVHWSGDAKNDALRHSLWRYYRELLPAL